LLSPLAKFHHEEWSHVSPFSTPVEHEKKLLSRIGPHPPPATYLLLLDDQLVGSVSLLKHDDIANVRPDLSPWLASLFVVPKNRGRGYGRKLLIYCIDQARALGFPSLYLYTHTHTDFYVRLGWRAIEERTSRCANVTVMQMTLDSAGTGARLNEKLGQQQTQAPTLSMRLNEQTLGLNEKEISHGRVS
jgi:GNAT superfamily N-acetyltransferase